MKPKLSIIMSTYNDEKYIRQALQSILDQTLQEWELIIINDKSTDSTESIIFEMFKNDKRLKYLKNSEQKGVTINIIKCMEMAKTELVARLDGDDYWLSPRKLERQYKIMVGDPSIGILGTWAKVVDPDGKTLYKIEYPIADERMRPRILRENPFVTSSIMFRKPSNYELSFFDQVNRYADDFNLVLHIGLKKKFQNLNRYYSAYRMNPAGISQSKHKLQIDDTMRTAKAFKKDYDGYRFAKLLWTLRKHYPVWLKGKLSMRIKKLMKFY